MGFDPLVTSNGAPSPEDKPEASCQNPDCEEYRNSSMNIKTTKYSYHAWCSSCDYTEGYEADYEDLANARRHGGL